MLSRRTPARARADAAKVVPALIDALTHKGSDVRRSSALKLGEFHELAKDAIPAFRTRSRRTATPGSAKPLASPCAHRSGTVSSLHLQAQDAQGTLRGSFSKEKPLIRGPCFRRRPHPVPCPVNFSEADQCWL